MSTSKRIQQDDAGDRRIIDVKVVAVCTDAEMVADVVEWPIVLSQ